MALPTCPSTASPLRRGPPWSAGYAKANSLSRTLTWLQTCTYRRGSPWAGRAITITKYRTGPCPDSSPAITWPTGLTGHIWVWGPGAHSCLNGNRFWDVVSPREYIRRVHDWGTGDVKPVDIIDRDTLLRISPVDNVEAIGPRLEMAETMFLGLRPPGRPER